MLENDELNYLGGLTDGEPFIFAFGNPTRSKPVVRLPRPMSVSGIVVRGSWIYWAVLDRDGAIMRASLSGGRVQRVVGHLKYASGLVTDGRFLYWLDLNAIGRVALDGSQANRRFIRPPREPNGGVGEGLATDGRYLYVGSCDRGRIGRVATGGSAADWSFIVLGRHSCPQNLVGWIQNGIRRQEVFDFVPGVGFREERLIALLRSGHRGDEFDQGLKRRRGHPSHS